MTGDQMQELMDRCGINSFEFRGFVGVFETNSDCEQLMDYFNFAKSMGLVASRRKTKDLMERDLSDDMINFSHVWAFEGVDFIRHNKTTVEACKSYVSAMNGCLELYHREFPSLCQFDLAQNFPQIQATKPGQGYHTFHFERWVGSGHSESSKRILATMMYLNDVGEANGGETEFLYQHLRINPKPGRVLIWPADWTHTHRGNPPLAGEKYIATSWVEAY